jgi:hypothetical protein
MIEDMTMRNFVEKTRNDYVRRVKTFTAFLGRSPDTATPEDLRRYAEVMGKGKTSVADEIFEPDYVDHMPIMETPDRAGLL